eukprot:Gb_19766 [translate_table: standard]
MTKCGPILLSIALPCFVKNVEHCAMITPYIIQGTQMGNNLRTSFTSSTFVTGHSLQQWTSLLSESKSSSIVALSRNLENKNKERGRNSRGEWDKRSNKIFLGQKLKISLSCSCGANEFSSVVHYVYIVEPKNTLEGIASEFGGIEEKIMSLNGISNALMLLAGQVLDVSLKGRFMVKFVIEEMDGCN